ncbi:MAG TPA: radical SAM protein [Verrucomicrobiae bacterium]|jgi:wyosine [tRNA(Phe)-imidazoG37] synthetase (radical SAM superfamily)|nr:radical SAM protein [Verrucomicrobiae bacterium]
MPAITSITEHAEKSRTPRVAKAFGYPRIFLGNRFVYTVVSARARGLAIGINMNPDQFCNFDCAYCEVNRELPMAERQLDVEVMAEELENTLFQVRSGKIREHAAYRELSNELLQLRHVALSGDGEPTLCPNFGEVIQVVVHTRARNLRDFFKLALITNGTGLDLRPVQDSIQYFTRDDEIWIKLDAGTQEHMDRVNRSQVPLEKVLANILLVGRQRPIIIQSLFPLVLGQEPSLQEIDEYILRLHDLKNGGAHISLVQIYSATRPIAHPDCGHLPLKKLTQISQRIKAETGLRAEVF